MANAFESGSYPTAEPTSLIVGDRWAWRRSLSDYPATDYTLNYEAVGHFGKHDLISITATNSSGDHLIEVAAATTAMLFAGTYSWAALITRNSDSERVRIASGVWTVSPNPTDAGDPRSVAKRALDDCEAVLATRNGRADSSYSIGDRSLTYLSDEELRGRREYWRAEYLRETQENLIAAGGNARTTIGIRL